MVVRKSGYPGLAVDAKATPQRESALPPPISVTRSDLKTTVHSIGLAEPEPTPAVSIVIVSHNCREPLRACLRSLADEREFVQLEVIVVDNDSRDDTGFLVSSEFPWVKLIVNRTNAGFARAINEGVAFTTGEYLLLLNPDTVIPAGALSRAVDELRSRPDVGMLGCKLVRPDGSFDHACKRGFPTVLSALYYFSGLAARFPDSPRFAQYTAAHLGIDETGTVDAINGAFMLVRRSAAEDVGALDERYWFWAEDLDWCHRFWKHGWEVLYWPEVEIDPPEERQRGRASFVTPQLRVSSKHLALLQEASCTPSLAVAYYARRSRRVVEVRHVRDGECASGDARAGNGYSWRRPTVTASSASIFC